MVPASLSFIPFSHLVRTFAIVPNFPIPFIRPQLMYTQLEKIEISQKHIRLSSIIKNSTNQSSGDSLPNYIIKIVCPTGPRLSQITKNNQQLFWLHVLQLGSPFKTHSCIAQFEQNATICDKVNTVIITENNLN